MKNRNELISKVLSGESSDEEREILEAWTKESPENKEYFSRFEEIWKNSEIKAELFQPDLKKALAQLDQKIAEAEKEPKHNILHYRKTNLFKYLSRVAAILIIGIGITFIIYPRFKSGGNKGNIEISTQSTGAEKRVVTLADGTKAYLNSNSKISFPQVFKKEQRVVFLEGEAFFEVTKNPERPFIIHANNSITKVLGTSFNVKAISGENAVTVTVNTGKVALYNKAKEDQKVLLTKGERGEFQLESGTVVKEINEDLNYLAWKTGILTFQNASFADVSAALSLHYKKEISVSESLSTCRLSTSFNDQSFEEVLEELSLMHPITIKKEGNKIILNGKGC